MTAELREEHRWLQRLVGEWVAESAEHPGVWTETVRSLGGTWTVAEGRGEMPGGGPAATLMTLGYDPQKGRFVGTWVGSMMTHLWVYDGALDETGNVLSLETEGPAMDGGGMAKYKDVIEFRGNEQRALTAYIMGDDGKWREFMKTSYRRKA
jgi:hypothetical protein